jgi:hypothetical protein
MRVCLAAAFALMASASQAQQLCFDATGPQKWVAERHGTWEKMSPNQWEFLRGVSAMNPDTPPGLAFGAAAALVTFPGQDSGEVFFLDEDRACTPMRIPKGLLDLLVLVGDGTITHQGQGM